MYATFDAALRALNNYAPGPWMIAHQMRYGELCDLPAEIFLVFNHGDDFSGLVDSIGGTLAEAVTRAIEKHAERMREANNA